MSVVLEAKKRDLKTKTKSLLKKSILPGVIYGKKVNPEPIEINYQDFRRALLKAGQGQLVTLSIDGKEYKVLIKSYDLDIVKNTFMHVDFLAVDMDKKVIAKIPIELYGESEAVRLGAILSQQMKTIEIRCKPDKLPVSFKASINKLVETTSHIYVSDLEGINEVESMVDMGLIVAGLLIPRSISAAEAEAEKKTEVAATGEAPKEGADKGEKK